MMECSSESLLFFQVSKITKMSQRSSRTSLSSERQAVKHVKTSIAFHLTKMYLSAFYTSKCRRTSAISSNS